MSPSRGVFPTQGLNSCPLHLLHWQGFFVFFMWSHMGSPMLETLATTAKLLQLCLTLCDPIDGSPPAPPSLGFSRQEHWSGLPSPSPKCRDTSVQFSSVQFSSVAQSCPTLCDPMNHSTPGLPVHHQLPEFTQIHVHRVGDAIQPSYPLSSPSPPARNPSQHQSLFQ